MTATEVRPAASAPPPAEKPSPAGALRQLVSGNSRQFGMIFALIALVVLFQVLTDGRTLTPQNVINLFNGNAYILILAIGMVLVIIAGHIDLSVGSVAAFAGIVVAIAMRDLNLPWFLGVLLGLALGALIGAWQGFWVAYVGIPAFIVTLAGMLLFRGANQYVGQSNTVPVPESFQYLGAGYLPEVGPVTGYNNLTVLLGLAAIAAIVAMTVQRRRRDAKLGAAVPPLWVDVVKTGLLAAALLFATWLFATGRPGTSFPVPGLILVVLIIVYGFVSTKTVVGRHIYAVGGNKHAAELSGVRSRRIDFLVMMNMSILAALAGMIFVGRSNASGPFDGVNWELDAIAAVFIGGAAVSGGVGTVIGSIIGGLVMAVLNNGLSLLGVGADATQIIKGLVLLAAVAFDIYNKKQGKPSISGLLFNRFGGGRRREADAAAASPGTPTKDTSELIRNES